MVISIVLLAVGGIALALLILLTVKKKLSPTWSASLIICGIIIGGSGGLGIRNILETRNREYGYIYTALRYMERNETEPAALYIRRVTDNEGYYLTAAQTLLEQQRGNDTVAKLRMGVLESITDGSDEQSAGVTRLKTWKLSGGDASAVAASLEKMIPLSEKRKEKLDSAFAIETGGWSEDLDHTEDSLYLLVNQAVGNRDWYSAVDGAVSLVREKASARNRLLLAQIVAEAKYDGFGLSTETFRDAKNGRDTWQEERDELMLKSDLLADEIELLKQELSVADKSRTEELNTRLEELTGEYERTGLAAENIFLERALNSIADIHSLEAQIVRARIRFAMGEKDEAVSVLRKASGSLQATLSGDRPLVNALHLVNDVYDTVGEPGVDSPEFREQVRVLLGAAEPELVNLSLTPLVSDFAQAVISDQKVYGSELYVVGIDTSEFPKIKVRLGGQKQTVEALTHGELTVVNDTHISVDTYEITYDTGAQAMRSVCFVVDTSGSMSGEPINDAKAAVNRFLDLMDTNAELSLVKFESIAYTVVGLTTGTSEVKNGVNSLYGGGGTEITAGIREGTEVLRRAKGAKIMILMTDGQSGLDTSVVQQAADEGITIFTVGFGDVSDDILQTIADMTGGQYIRAESSEELINVYSSLQSLIGNTVTVTYTIENTTETQRYFYITDGESSSARREYFIGESGPGEKPLVITLTSTPSILRRERLDSLISRNSEAVTEIDIYGTGLDLVSTASYGDIKCRIAGQSYDRLTLQVPASIADGIYDLILKTGDGTECVFRYMLAVGTEFGARRYVYGDIAIRCSDAYIAGTDSLVLLDPRLSEAAPADIQTLSVLTTGILVAEDFVPPAEIRDDVSLDTGALTWLHGILYLDYYDSAYNGNDVSTVMNGTVILRYDGSGSSIVPVEEIER